MPAARCRPLAVPWTGTHSSDRTPPEAAPAPAPAPAAAAAAPQASPGSAESASAPPLQSRTPTATSAGARPRSPPAAPARPSRPHIAPPRPPAAARSRPSAAAQQRETPRSGPEPPAAPVTTVSQNAWHPARCSGPFVLCWPLFQTQEVLTCLTATSNSFSIAPKSGESYSAHPVKFRLRTLVGPHGAGADIDQGCRPSLRHLSPM